MVLSTMYQEEVPVWLVLVVLGLFGIWALGRYEGWWDKIRNKRKKNNG